MAKITNINFLLLEMQPIPKYKIWVNTIQYNKNRHRIIIRVNNTFYDIDPNSLQLDINIYSTEPNQVNVKKVLRIYAQLYDYVDDTVIQTTRMEYNFSIPLQKYVKVEEELLSSLPAVMDNYWTQGKLVSSITGPYDTNGQIVTELKMGETYLYRAIPNQELKPLELLTIQWAYKYDNHKTIKFKYQEEIFVQNSNVIYCKFPKKDTPTNITVYAYFIKPSDKVAINTQVFSEDVKIIDDEVENEVNNEAKTNKITLEILDKFMSKTKHGSISKKAPYSERIPAYIDYLNLYMEKFEINTNLRKAHFLGQVAKETKFWSYEEDFIYSINGLITTFKNFKTEEGKEKAKELGYSKNKEEITKEIEIQVGNYAYGIGKKATELGNNFCTIDKLKEESQDGYNYRARGLIQITGKTNYTAFQKWYDDKKEILELDNQDFVKNPNVVLEPKYVVLSAISFQDKNKLNILADKGIEKKDILAISNVINSGESNEKKIIRREYVQAAYEELNGKAKEGYSIDLAVEYLINNALAKSQGKCALYVRKSINAGGIIGISGNATEYYDTNKLIDVGFTNIGNDIDEIVIKRGDIVAFSSVKGHPYGHIAMYDGSQWISDFKQKSFWVATQYSTEKKYYVFRWN